MREVRSLHTRPQDDAKSGFGRLVRNRIRDIRVKKGIKQADMAARLELPGQGAYSKMERGQQMISFETLARIADILDVDVTSLMRKGSIMQENEITFGAMTIRELSNLWGRREYAEMVTIAERAKGAEYFQDVKNLIKLVSWQARAYYRLEQYEKTIEISLPMLDAADEIVDRYWVAFTYCNLSVAYDWLLQPEESYRMIVAAREEFDTRFGDTTDLFPYLLFNLGNMQANRHDFTEARMNLNNALSLSKSGLTERIFLHGNIALTLSFVHLQEGDYEAGLACARQAHDYYQVIGDLRGLMESRNNIAVLLDELGRDEEADKMYQEVYAIAKANPGLVRPFIRASLLDEGFEL